MTEPRATSRRRPPLDPRLLRASRSARRYVVASAAFAIGNVVAVVASAIALAGLLSEVITDPAARGFAAQSVHLTVLAVALTARGAMSYFGDRVSRRAAHATIDELRVAALDTLTDPGQTSPRRLLDEREHALTVVLRGLDRLSDYLSGYLPALLSTVVITPLIVVVELWTDPISGVIIIVTLPLIPVFMVLIGLVTRDRTRRKLAAMSRQNAQLVDLMTGLPTLRALGRAQGPAGQVAELGERLHRSTMGSLRIAFLSGAVLELLATLSVALVAVSIGLRLVFGEMSLYAGVLALVLAPEAYLPLRQIGAQFHNAEDGVAAADDVLDLIESGRAASRGTARAAASGEAEASSRPGEVGVTVELDRLGIRGRDGWAPRGLSATARPGELTVFTGPNGAGKSTVLAAVLGLHTPDEGRVLIAGRDLASLDRDAHYGRLVWLPQHPVIVPGTVAENLDLFGELPKDAVAEAMRASAFDEVLADLPDGMDSVLGSGGAGLSAGQRQRLALTRTLASPAPLLLLDEPTAHLDEGTAGRVIAALVDRARAGDTVIVVSHQKGVLSAADAVVDFAKELSDGR
ncbi:MULTISPECIES: thiol reductant ABC exporter subunit CydD [Gordonia]|uniref:ABC transporter permease/ATP-binding protein CydD n=1 Tax=Gordonia sihwensis NBRC 108236 TaxID=1223544 RepID=L7LJU1_9ACTN|nr:MULTISPECIES: thiol reductant ABC exporter subunit CydD [Gordonia]AUH68087.1 thiol reductant ABC exporter subunit CydD [Gordonia sp. YC-JH1]GAC60372.1 ABC transporter permease/ATP-binding protein CydD [Gordonia sihwensis NBRC 108236]